MGGRGGGRQRAVSGALLAGVVGRRRRWLRLSVSRNSVPEC